MARIIELTIEPPRTDDVIHQVAEVDGIVALRVDRRVGVSPPADVVHIDATNRGARHVMRILVDPSRFGILSLSSTEPMTMLSPQHQTELDRESSEASWSDVAGHLRGESNADLNILLLMFLSGGIAAVGIGTDALHIVVAAMVVTPGFETLLRIPFSLVVKSHGSLQQALVTTVAGYLLMAMGGAVGYLLLVALQGTSSLATLDLVRYWTQLDAAAVILAAIAGTAGAVTITANRAIFTAGVMIALALVPGMTLVGMGIAAGEPSVALDGGAQWAMNGGVVMVTAAIVIGTKHVLLHGPTSTH